MTRLFIKRRFIHTYDAWIRRLEAASRTQSIKGLTADEVLAEMIAVLWQAHRAYDPRNKVPFDAYFWTCWRRHKVTMFRKLGAGKRSATIVPIPEDSELMVTYRPDEEFPSLTVTGFDPAERAVWHLICMGYNAKEIMEQVGLSTRRYYTLIGHWRQTPEVRDSMGRAPSQGRKFRLPSPEDIGND